MFAGNRRRQDAAGANFDDRIERNLEPPDVAPIYGAGSEREYGSTYPFQSFGQAARVNRPTEIAHSSRLVKHSLNNYRGPLVGRKVV